VRGLLVLSALLHDVAKPQTRSVGKDGRIHFYRHDEVGADVTARRLASAPLSPEEVEFVRASVFHHLRPAMLARSSPSLPKRVVGKYRRDLGDLGPEVCLLAIGDRLGKGGVEDLDALAAYVDQNVQLIEACLHEPEPDAPPPEPLVRGTDIIALGAPEGPAVGAILKAIDDAHERGEIEDKDAALALAARLIASRA
jgi:poly(A) polymerase